MKNNYRRLGDYIKKVNVRNTDNLDIPLMGLTIDKKFIPSVANTIGTDLSKYKVVYKNQFACSLMQVSRDGKMPIARLDEEAVIMSPAYPIFKVTKPEILLPEYLEMWFKRDEFDREAAFYAVGGVRGNLTWEDFCDMTLPIPSIEKQRQIVADYQAVENKIKTNEAICEKLEETAQTIYRRWFEEFEFPDEEGKPYKGNGGEMVWNEELDKEVPKGWEVKKIKEVSKINAGGDRPKVFSETKNKECFVPIFSNGITQNGLYGFTDKPKIKENAITVSARGTIGFAVMRLEPFVPIVRLITVIPNDGFLFRYLFDCIENFQLNASGSVQKQLTVPHFSMLELLIPNKETLIRYQQITDRLLEQSQIIIKQNQQLHQLQSLLLGRMTRGEE